MRKIDRLLAEYGESHQNATNKAIHWICVPLIFLSIMGLIWSIPQGFLTQLADAPLNAFINWATLILVMVLFYYLRLSVSLFFGMLLLVGVFVAITYWVDQSQVAPLWLVSLIIFALAWIGQFYGHKVEGKKPSFFKDLQFLLIGPAWLMHFIYKKLNIPY
jgi:uncharacterized membrane protein YGL010W